jgi:hypothetical protein
VGQPAVGGVIVAHARNVQLITKSRRKDDRIDARTLARLARIDPQLLSPVKHRSAKAQMHLTEIRARAELVSARTALVNSARGLTKSYGERLRKCGTQQVGRDLGCHEVGDAGMAFLSSLLLCSRYHDLNQDVRPPQRSLDAKANWWILAVYPLVPNGVVIFKILPVRQPHGRRQKFRFVCACLLQKTVDGFQDFFSLNANISAGLGRHTTCTNNAVVHHDQANHWEYMYAVQVFQSLGRADALNGHVFLPPVSRSRLFDDLDQNEEMLLCLRSRRVLGCWAVRKAKDRWSIPSQVSAVFNQKGVVIDLSPMKGITVDPEKQTALARTGNTAEEILAATPTHGLAPVPGECGTVGSGLALGGGLGWLSGKYGATSDNVLGVHLIAADGRTLKTDASINEDLFWAIRGPGGNFGVATLLEYQLHPVGGVLAGELVFQSASKNPFSASFETSWRMLRMNYKPSAI